MEFYSQDRAVREREISRIMAESIKRFNHEACAREYISLYEKMLDRPLVRED
jgi:starch synthase/alpha-amylase